MNVFKIGDQCQGLGALREFVTLVVMMSRQYTHIVLEARVSIVRPCVDN